MDDNDDHDDWNDQKGEKWKVQWQVEGRREKVKSNCAAFSYSSTVNSEPHVEQYLLCQLWLN